MTEKLKYYQVLDVLCRGTFYKVRHKVTNKIFTWKAYDCSGYSDEQIHNIVNEVKSIGNVLSETLLRYYNTILHAPSKTLYIVLEYNSWQSVQELIESCKATDKYLAEGFIWHLLLELARVCKAVETLNFTVLQKCIRPSSIFVGENCELRVNCFDLHSDDRKLDLIRHVGEVIHTLCYLAGACDDKIKEFHYSDDLRDIISFLTDERNANICPDVILYHPTVLSNIDTLSGPKSLRDILLPSDYFQITSEVNQCDSEKVVALSKTIEPAPRYHLRIAESPVYSNISPKKKFNEQIEESKSNRGSLSPTIAALALELPGYVPRCRKPYSEALQPYNPQKISEETFSQQWMSRLIALRQREESLNKRERELIAKEIVNSPAVKVVPHNDSQDNILNSNGITLPPMMNQAAHQEKNWVSRRRHKRSSSVRTRSRRKSYAYEDLDSSLSADPGDGSIIITATKFTKENMPKRNIFPDVSTKKVHFTSSNPFTESDESVTLTFYELESLDQEGYQVPRQDEKVLTDINKFKYLDLEKITSEKRAAMNWSHSSPSKQAKVTTDVFSDITNTSIRKTPSKTSLMSKGSNTSRYSLASTKSQCDSFRESISSRTRSSAKPILQTPVPDVKKSKRKSLIPFKTPFKFLTSTKT